MHGVGGEAVVLPAFHPVWPWDCSETCSTMENVSQKALSQTNLYRLPSLLLLQWLGLDILGPCQSELQTIPCAVYKSAACKPHSQAPKGKDWEGKHLKWSAIPKLQGVNWTICWNWWEHIWRKSVFTMLVVVFSFVQLPTFDYSSAFTLATGCMVLKLMGSWYNLEWRNTR